MGKSIRSKIKRYWRTQLRNTIGKDNLEKQEALIQEKLKNALETQSKWCLSVWSMNRH